MDHDTSWCPVCDRAIQPKRLQVPVPQPIQPPAPPPSSPRRTKSPVKQRQGLVQGTGRAKPNGTLKQQPTVTRYRTVIDQGPTPLYCSNECHSIDRSRTIDSSDDSSSLNSVESRVSVPQTQATSVPDSLVTMAKLYGWAPFPPPAPVDDVDPHDSVPPVDYNNGIIMTGRRINSEFVPPPLKRDGRLPAQPRKQIPGWTDGSHAWRSTVYNLAAADASTPPKHQSFALRGSRGVQSTFSHPRQQAPSSLPGNIVSDEDRDRLDKFSQSFRRVSSSPKTISPCSVPSKSFPPSRKERPLVQRGAEGKLLVPNVVMRTNSHASSTSLSSEWSPRNVRSPLAQEDSSSDDGDETSQMSETPSSLPRPKRPTVEARSWSYDNVKTYPTMRIPQKTRIEKRKEKQVVGGQEVEVEVEVEVEEKPKCLFLFAPWKPTVSV